MNLFIFIISILTLIFVGGGFLYELHNKISLIPIPKKRKRYRCKLCGRCKFDRDYQPHNCNHNFRKRLSKFEEVIDECEHEWQQFRKEFNEHGLRLIDSCKKCGKTRIR